MNKTGYISYNIAELSKPAILVLLNMAQEMSKDNIVNIETKTIADKIGYSERSVKRAMRELKQTGVLERIETVYCVSKDYIYL